MDSHFAIYFIPLFLLAFTAYRWYTRPSLKHIAGDEAESWWLGHFPRIFREEVGSVDLEWVARYGRVVRFKAPFGEDRLMITDPKAIQYIFHTSGYTFCKPKDRLEFTRLTTGRGLVFAEGETHKRQRRVMLPGFGMPEARAFVPIFSASAAKISEQWNDTLGSSPKGSVTINVCGYLQRATLDAIGEAAFDYSFNAMQHSDEKLVHAYSSLLLELFSLPNSAELFVQGVLGYTPARLRTWFVDHMKSTRLERARESRRVTTAVAKELVKEKTQAALQGVGNKDILSVLVQSNASQNSRGKLEDYEIIEQMQTIMLAGHETTANTMNWALLELARNPSIQSRLRKEIWEYEDKVQARGTEWTATDFEGMPYLSAFIKEVLRMYPVAFHLNRQASEDVLLPLSTPITATNGELLDSVLVPKGTKVIASIFAYNRDKGVWGPDADMFKPERWIKTDKKRSETPVGVYGNLFTFSGGIRSCIGWRFAVTELHAFVVELVGKFEYTFAEPVQIRREPCGVMVPTIVGDFKSGQQLPLTISAVTRE